MSKTLVATKPSKQTRSFGEKLAFIASEQARIATERRIDADWQQHIEDDLTAEQEYQEWKRQNGLGNLDRTGYGPVRSLRHLSLTVVHQGEPRSSPTSKQERKQDMTDHQLTDEQAEEIAAFEQACEEEYQTIQRAQAQNILLYAIITDRLAIPVRFLMPDKLSPDWYSPRRFWSAEEASQAFLDRYPGSVQISPEMLEGASEIRLARAGLAR